MNKLQSRKRRSAKTKLQLKRLRVPRIVVFRSNKHIYAQLVVMSDNGDLVKASASSIEEEIKAQGSNKSDIASQVGKELGKRIVELGLSKIAFDRSGYKYHGRVKALADGIREQGVEF